MVYKYHQTLRDLLGIDSSVFTEEVFNLKLKKHIRNARRSHPRIPYTIEVECNFYWGNFKRQFIAYSLGILDDVQMRIHYSNAELAMFWKEVFNKDQPIGFKDAIESYELMRDYLFETFEDVDDWEQLTFYKIDWETYHRDGRDVLIIQLAKPLSEYWESIIIPRMKDFFAKKIYKYMKDGTALIGIRLCDRKGNVVKEY